MTKTPEELYKEREKRVNDAVALRKPDAVPILPFFSFFVAHYAGMTIQEVMYDPDKLIEAQMKTLLDFQPDMDNNPFTLRFLGPLLEALDFKQLLWPGHGHSSDHTYQFVEGEYMTADEYDHFLLDPLDFMIRRYWPRVFGVMKGFEKLPPLHNIISYYMGVPTGFAMFATPEVQFALDAFKKAGEKSRQIIVYSGKFTAAAKAAGFPMQFGGVTQAPFDTLGDYYRGTKGLMLDMYRRPEKVTKACEKLFSFMIELGVNAARDRGYRESLYPCIKDSTGLCQRSSSRSSSGPP